MKQGTRRWRDRNELTSGAEAVSGEVPLADILKQAFRRILHQVEYVLETIGTAVIRVRHLRLRRVRGEVEEGTDHRAATAEGGNREVVVLVHGKDIVEGVAVFRCDPARPLGAEVKPTQARAPPRPLVGRASDVPGSRTRGVNEDLILEALAPQDVLEDALSKGRTTYIAHTNE